MYDGNKVIAGLVIFVVLMIFPIWYNHGNAGTPPKPEKPKDLKECVKPTAFMRTSHMQLIDAWRDEALREGNRQKIPVAGVEYEKSLMIGCMKCHSDKKKFCDECHNYSAVKPYCWDCHFPPKEALAPEALTPKETL